MFKKVSRVAGRLLSLAPYHQKAYQFWYNNFHDYEIQNYESPVNVIKLLYVNPNTITKGTRRPLPAWTEFSLGQVMEGEWDQRHKIPVKEPYDTEWFDRLIHGHRIEETVLHNSLFDHFEKGVGWRDTEYYNTLIAALENGRRCPPGADRNEIIQRLQQLDKVFHSIQKNGYKSQQEMKPKPFKEQLLNEIRVDIGRNGDLLLVDGRHRLSMAKILDINKIPVIIEVRHKKWAESRVSFFKNKTPTNHPDIEEYI